MKVSNTQEIDQIQSLDSSLLALTNRRLRYLGSCVRRFGIQGALWWFKTYQQQDSFNDALDRLRASLEKEQLSFVLIAETFSQFIIPEEDQGYVDWYVAAHNKLLRLEQSLDKDQHLNIDRLEAVISELKYISGADKFHETYQLGSIQQKVTLMYQQLQDTLNEQQLIEKQKLEVEKLKQQSNLARAEADKKEAEAKAKTMESVKEKERRLAIIEERKYKLAECEALELKAKELKLQEELEAKKADSERQEALQKSYQELELKESVKDIPLEELVEIVKKKIENKKILTFIQQDQLAKLKQTIESKNTE